MNKPDGPTLTPLLMFSGDAEKAMGLYTGLFENSKVVEIMCIDSPVEHDFTFTPATSLRIVCSDRTKLTSYFDVLSKDGQIMMPLAEYPFSKKFAWVQDRFGVSWQLSVS
jgi:predicted 3-demethylubiquinone-9 3-methyltransferase (glyoxalase superfamily)